MNIEIFYEEEQSLYEEEERCEEDVEVEQNLESQLSVHAEVMCADLCDRSSPELISNHPPSWFTD